MKYCDYCGNTLTNDASEDDCTSDVCVVHRLTTMCDDYEKERQSVIGWLKMVERILNDQTVYGPGAPHIPGLFEVRTALGQLRKSLALDLPKENLT